MVVRDTPSRGRRKGDRKEKRSEEKKKLEIQTERKMKK